MKYCDDADCPQFEGGECAAGHDLRLRVPTSIADAHTHNWGYVMPKECEFQRSGRKAGKTMTTLDQTIKDRLDRECDYQDCRHRHEAAIKGEVFSHAICTTCSKHNSLAHLLAKDILSNPLCHTEKGKGVDG